MSCALKTYLLASQSLHVRYICHAMVDVPPDALLSGPAVVIQRNQSNHLCSRAIDFETAECGLLHSYVVKKRRAGREEVEKKNLS
jgi:hypothetical protein